MYRMCYECFKQVFDFKEFNFIVELSEEKEKCSKCGENTIVVCHVVAIHSKRGVTNHGRLDSK